MRKKTFFLLITAMLGGMLLIGCEPGAVKPAPRNMTQYKQMGRADRKRYTTESIVRYNITFILNNERPLQERKDSLALLKYIVGRGYKLDNASMDELAMLLQDKTCPPELSQEVLTFLLAENYSDIAAHVIPLMQKMQTDPKLRKLIINWLRNNPVPEMLGGIVRTWAMESPRSSSEKSYRETVQEITGKTWDVALLDAINTPGFTAPGDALDILSTRISRSALRRRIVALTPRSDAVKALQVFIDQFNYLPQNNSEFISELVIYKVRRDMLSDAARQNVDWDKSHSYQFNVQDFHLLSRLARDPLRNNLNRTQLVLDVGKKLKRRRHVKHTAAAGAKYDEGFWRQVDKLSMVDLWNIYLLDEMLSRPRDQIYWKIFADGDLDDKNSAWGGLIFYRNGQAEAHIYPPDPDAIGDDQSYPPSSKLITDSRDAMCRFITHFDKVSNADRAGPTARELADAKANNYYGLVFTRLSAKKFCVHYFNPQGVVVSLGTFPFRENRSR